MKYSINTYSTTGELSGTYGTDFVSTNTFIKAVKALQKIEGVTDIEVIVTTLSDVVTYIIPSLDVDTVRNNCDVADMLYLVKQVVNKMAGIEASKN